MEAEEIIEYSHASDSHLFDILSFKTCLRSWSLSRHRHQTNPSRDQNHLLSTVDDTEYFTILYFELTRNLLSSNC